MNKIVIRTVTQGYVVETHGGDSLFPLEYAAETVEKVKEIIELLLVVERENKNVNMVEEEEMVKLTFCNHEWVLPQVEGNPIYCKLCGLLKDGISIGCRHEWVTDQATNPTTYCKLCGEISKLTY